MQEDQTRYRNMSVRNETINRRKFIKDQVKEDNRQIKDELRTKLKTDITRAKDEKAEYIKQIKDRNF
jgi:hypothetical protein